MKKLMKWTVIISLAELILIVFMTPIWYNKRVEELVRMKKLMKWTVIISLAELILIVFMILLLTNLTM